MFNSLKYKPPPFWAFGSCFQQRPDISFFEDIISYPYPGPQKGYYYYILSLSREKKDMDILCVPMIPQQLAAGPAYRVGLVN
jgi:hypothetical protein